MSTHFPRRFTAVLTLLGLLVGSHFFQIAHAESPPSNLPFSFTTKDGVVHSFSIPSANVGAGGSIAVGDVDGDEREEILVAPGIGNEPRVHIFHADGTEAPSFLTYDSTMGIGINLLTCDLNGDGKEEIITAPQHGGGPQVRIFTAAGTALDAGGTFVYNESFHGGVNLACGPQGLITLPGAGGGPHVRVWKLGDHGLVLVKEWFAGNQDDRTGLVGAVLEDGTLWIASSKGLPARLVGYDMTGEPKKVGEESIFAQTDGTGVESLASQNGTLLIGLTGVSKEIQFTPKIHDWSETPSPVVSPVFATGDIDNDGASETVVIQGRPLYGGTEDTKSIVVDVSDQRLYSYENGTLANTFLVSTARAPYTTPRGTHKVLAKVDEVHYAGTDLDGTKWDLGWVPYNLRFYPKHYIHYAYWHNNFGHPMSHGCVNVNLTNMKWIYEWSEVNTPIIVRD